MLGVRGSAERGSAQMGNVGTAAEPKEAREGPHHK